MQPDESAGRVYSRPAATLVFLLSPTAPEAAAIIEACIGDEPSNLAAWRGLQNSQRPARAIALTSRRFGVVSEELNDHIEWATERAGRAAAQLQALIQRGVECRLVCMWFAEVGHGGPEITPKALGKLASLGLSLGFDVYRAPPKEREGK